MKQIVDKLNKIAKAIDENVELSDRDLIIDSLDSITKAFGGTPNNSNLIVDKLDDIASVVHGGGGSAAKKVVIISEQTIQGELHEGEQMYTADVNLENELTSFPDTLNVVLDGTEYTAVIAEKSSEEAMYMVGGFQNPTLVVMFSEDMGFATVALPDGDQHTIKVYAVEQPSDPSKYVIISERTVQGEDAGQSTYPTGVILTNQMIDYPQELNVKLDGVEYVANGFIHQSSTYGYIVGENQESFLVIMMFNELEPYAGTLVFPDGDQHTIEVYTAPKETSTVEVRTCTITIDNKSDQDVYVGDMFNMTERPRILNDGIIDSTVASEVVPIGSQKEIKLIYSTGTNEINAEICYLASSLGVNSFENQINCEIVNTMLIATDKTHDSSATLVYNVK